MDSPCANSESERSNLQYQIDRSQIAHENSKIDLHFNKANLPIPHVRDHLCDSTNANKTRERSASRFVLFFYYDCPRRNETERTNQNFDMITASIARELNILTGVKASSGSEPRMLERVNGARGVERTRVQERTMGWVRRVVGDTARGWTMLLPRAKIAKLVEWLIFTNC